MEIGTSRIGRALAATGVIVDGVRADQWALPTPCADWSVRTLVNHLVGGLRIFSALIEDRPVLDHDGTDWLGDDPRAAYRSAAAADARAWSRAGVGDLTFALAVGDVPGPLATTIHLTEIVVHGVDLAVATGQEAAVDEELAAELLATMRATGIDAFRQPGIFGPEVPAQAGEPAHRSLLHYLGRSPQHASIAV